MNRDSRSADEQRWSAWMARAQAGDQADYTRLLTELAKAIEIYIRVRFGALDVLEDCVQECLIAVHLARHTYDARRPFRPWLFTVVRHKAIDVLRQRATWFAAAAVLVDESTNGDTEHLLRRIDGVRILERLHPDQREAVTLAKYGGLTASEAAAWLGISESALKARLQRGLGAIRKFLDGEGDVPCPNDANS